MPKPLAESTAQRLMMGASQADRDQLSVLLPSCCVALCKLLNMSIGPPCCKTGAVRAHFSEDAYKELNSIQEAPNKLPLLVLLALC